MKPSEAILIEVLNSTLNPKVSYFILYTSYFITSEGFILHTFFILFTLYLVFSFAFLRDYSPALAFWNRDETSNVS